MTDMGHMEQLEAVAASDIAVLRRKEATYNGSWKASGGRSAWFMLRRKMDRLLVMMAQPEAPHGFSLADLDDVLSAGDGADDLCMAQCITQHLRDAYVAEDVFHAIEASPYGVDGSALAEVRDLRRYLLLVEAEMVARGVVAPEGGARGVALPQGTEAEEALRVARQDVKVEVVRDASARTLAGYYGVKEEASTAPSPEAGSQHASLTPWAVSLAWRYRTGLQEGGQRSAAFSHFWTQQNPNLWTLEPWATGEHALPSELYQLYAQHDGGWLLKVAQCPPDARDWFPRLRLELNMTELEAQPGWQRGLYRWQDQGQKFCLLEWHAAWGREV